MRVQDYLDAKRKKKTTAPQTSDKPTRREQAPRAAKPTGTLGYFDPSRGCFWVKNANGNWIQHTEAAFKRMLRYEVYHEIESKEIREWNVERHVMHAMRNDDIAFCQPLAGYQAGIHEVMGQRILCASGPNLLTPAAGKWPHLKQFLDELLGERTNVFHSWLRASLRSLYVGAPFRPGQMLVLAGPRACGKSLLQNVLTEILGGRVAKPYRYMTDRTQFNSDLLGAEHLMIEDDAASRDLPSRRHFGAQLKNMIAGEGQSLHRKGRDAIMVNPFWRITLSVNDEPENLMVLPPLDESIEDKVILLKCNAANFPYSPDDIKARQRFRIELSAEIPAYLFWLKTFNIPEKMKGQRYGVVAFHDQELKQALIDLQPEMKLWSLIHNLQIWSIDNETFSGTANDLEELLLQKDKLNRVAKLFYYDSSCGVYLARLMKLFPDRVKFEEDRTRKRTWQISHPDRCFSI